MVDELTTTAWKVIYNGELDHALGNYQYLRQALESVLAGMSWLLMSVVWPQYAAKQQKSTRDKIPTDAPLAKLE